MLGGEEDFAIGSERLFQSEDAGLAAHNERGHHKKEDDHVANRDGVLWVKVIAQWSKNAGRSACATKSKAAQP
jgi:hypothetical protein